MLGRRGWRIVSIRAYADPLPDLEKALAEPKGKARRLLIVLDQFEEFVIVEGRAQSESGRRFIERIGELRATSVPGVTVLFALRSDYLNSVIELGLDDLVSGRTWQEIDPFKRPAAREFLAASPQKPSAELVERILDGAEAIEEVKGLLRPVTLNMLGLVLENFDQEVSRSPERLIPRYLTDAIQQPFIREIAPKVVGLLITEAGTKWPRSVADLAAASKLSEPQVKLCLARLASKGLVRPLDQALSVWEIAHDFIAKQLATILGRLRPSPWRSAALWSSRWALRWRRSWRFGACRIYQRDTAMSALQDIWCLDIARPKQTLRCEVSGTTWTIRSLAAAAPALASPGRSDARPHPSTPVSSVEPLKGLTALQTLDLSGTQVSSIEPLKGLTALQTLDLSARR